MSPRAVDVLQLQWGWITPGTGENNRREQCDRHLAFLAEHVTPQRRHFLLTHCGWWLDREASPAVRNLTGKNPEPHRGLTPCNAAITRGLKAYSDRGRLDFAVYPYAACVAEATTGEGLLRSLRLSRDIAAETFGQRPQAVLNHDCIYDLHWGAVQMPRIARLLGFDVIIAGVDGTVVGPDGAAVRLVGFRGMNAFLQSGEWDGRPIFHPLELAQNLRFHTTLDEGGITFPDGRRPSFRAITLGEYCRRVPARPRRDSRELGSKGWYGGTIDSLVLEQNVKLVELRLPAIEALAVLTGRANAAVCRRLEDLWKKSFILMDNHTLWQCHNYKAHYLPASFQLRRETEGVERQVLARVAGSGGGLAVFNTVPWRRDIALTVGRSDYVLRSVPGWGAEAVGRDRRAATKADRRVTLLENDRVAFRLNRRGEAVGIRDGDGMHAFEGLGRLLRIHETSSKERRTLRAGQPLRLEGSVSASCEIEMAHRPAGEIFFEMADLAGACFLLQADRLNARRMIIGTEWVPLHSLHWGGGGLPRHRMHVAPKRLNATSADAVRITLWMLSEGEVRLGPARVRVSPERFDAIRNWQAVVHYRNGYSGSTDVRASVVRSNDAMKTVRFAGRLPDARFRMDVTLRSGSEALEYALRLSFPKPTPLGLSSPPFTREDGSLLGAQCERPYVPGVSVLFPLPGKARYFADKPYFIREMLKAAPDTWHTDARDWWLGMSPFIGMNLAAAEWDKGQLGLLTRGLKHFYRWRRDGENLLGLSLGASLIHQATQGHSAPPSSALHETIKRTDHDPYFETPFLYAHGAYEFHYAVSRASRGAAARRRLWRRAREFALPPVAVRSRAANGTLLQGVNVAPEQVVLAGMERRSDHLLLRLVNMSGRKVRARARIPLALSHAEMEGKPVAISRGAVEAPLPPWALREVCVTPA